MTKFDVFMEKREEERFKQRNEALDCALLSSLRLRTKEEVMKELFELLVIPLGCTTVGSRREVKNADCLVF